MYSSFNCGTGLDVVAPPRRENDIMAVADEFGMGCKAVGHCERSRDGKNHLHISSEFGKFDYDAE
jgi:phosphoribosylaminoimidazole (AIR) synthetase